MTIFRRLCILIFALSLCATSPAFGLFGFGDTKSPVEEGLDNIKEKIEDLEKSLLKFSKSETKKVAGDKNGIVGVLSKELIFSFPKAIFEKMRENQKRQKDYVARLLSVLDDNEYGTIQDRIVGSVPLPNRNRGASQSDRKQTLRTFFQKKFKKAGEKPALDDIFNVVLTSTQVQELPPHVRMRHHKEIDKIMSLETILLVLRNLYRVIEGGSLFQRTTTLKDVSEEFAEQVREAPDLAKNSVFKERLAAFKDFVKKVNETRTQIVNYLTNDLKIPQKKVSNRKSVSDLLSVEKKVHKLIQKAKGHTKKSKALFESSKKLLSFFQNTKQSPITMPLTIFDAQIVNPAFNDDGYTGSEATSEIPVNSNYLLDAMLSKDAFNNGPQGGNQNANRHGRYRLAGTSFFDIDDLTPKKSGKKPKETQLHKDLAEAYKSSEKLEADLATYRDEYILPAQPNDKGTYWAYLNTRMKSVKNTLLASGLSDIEKRVGCLIALHRLKKRYFWQPAATANADPHRSDHKMVTSGYQRNGNDHPWLFEVDNGPYQSGAPHNVRKIIEDLKANHIFDHYITPLELKPYHVDMPEYRRLHHALEKLKEYVDDSFFNDHVGEAGLQFNFPLTLTEAPLALADRFMHGTESEITEDFRVSKKDASRKREQSEQAAHDDWVAIKNERLQDVSDERIETMEQYGRARADRRAREAYVLKHGSSLKEKLKIRGRRLKEGVSDIGITHYKRDKRFKADDHYTDLTTAYQAHTRDGLDEDKARGKAAAYADHKYSHNSPTAHYSGGDFGTGIDDNDPNVSDAEKAAARRFRRAYYDELRRIMKISDNTQLREIAASWFIRANYETFKNFARGVVLEAYDRALAVLKEAKIKNLIQRIAYSRSRDDRVARFEKILYSLGLTLKQAREKVTAYRAMLEKQTRDGARHYSLEEVSRFIKRSISDAYDQHLAAKTQSILKRMNKKQEGESEQEHQRRINSQEHKNAIKQAQQERTSEIIHVDGVLANNQLNSLKTTLADVEAIIPGPHDTNQNVSSQILATRILDQTKNIITRVLKVHITTDNAPASDTQVRSRHARLNQTFGPQAPALIATYTRGLESANRILADVRADLDNNNLLTPPGGINIQTEGPQRFIEQFESIQKALVGANAVSNPIFSGVQKGEDNPFTVGRTAHTYGAEAEYLITRSMAEKAGNWNRFIREVWSNFTVYVKEISRTIAHKVKADTDAEHDEDVRHYVDLRRYLDALTLISSDEVPVGTPVDERSKWARNPLDIRNEDHLTRLGHMLNILGHFFYKHLPSENRERLELLQALKLHQSGYNELALILSDLDGRAPLASHRVARQVTVAQLFRSLQDHMAQQKQIIVGQTLSYQELEAQKATERTKLTAAYPGRDMVYDSAQMHITGEESPEEQLRKLRDDAVFLMQTVLQHAQLHIERLLPRSTSQRRSRILRRLQEYITTITSFSRDITHLDIQEIVEDFLTTVFPLGTSSATQEGYNNKIRSINRLRGAEYQKHMHDIFDTLLIHITQGRYVSPPERFPQGTVHGIENSASLNQAWTVFCQLINNNIDVFIQHLPEGEQNQLKRRLEQFGSNYSYDNIHSFFSTFLETIDTYPRTQSNAPELVTSLQVFSESVQAKTADLIREQRANPIFRYAQVAIMQSLATTFMSQVDEIRSVHLGRRARNILRQGNLSRRARVFAGKLHTRRAAYTALRNEIITALQNLFDAVEMMDDLPVAPDQINMIFEQIEAIRTAIPLADAQLRERGEYPGAEAHLLNQFFDNDSVDAAVGSLIAEMQTAHEDHDRHDPSLLTNLETQLDTARGNGDPLQKARAYMALSGRIRAAMYDLLMAHKHDKFRMRSARLFIIALVAHRVTNTPEGNLERVQDELKRAAPDSGQTLTWQNICDELADMIVRISEGSNPPRSALIAAARKVRTTPLYSQEYETHLTALSQELSHLLPEDNDANRYVKDALIISELIDIGHSFSDDSNDYYNLMANGLGIQHALSTNPRGVAQVFVEDIRNFSHSAIAGVPAQIRTADTVAFRQDLQTTIIAIRSYLGGDPARARHHFDAARYDELESIQGSIVQLVSRLSEKQFGTDTSFVDIVSHLEENFKSNIIAQRAMILASNVDSAIERNNFADATETAKKLLTQLRQLRSSHTGGPAHPQPGPTAGAPAGHPSGTGGSGGSGQGHGGSGDGSVASLAQRIYQLAFEKTGTRATALNPQWSWKQYISAAREKLNLHLKNTPMRKGDGQYVRKVQAALAGLGRLDNAHTGLQGSLRKVLNQIESIKTPATTAPGGGPVTGPAAGPASGRGGGRSGGPATKVNIGKLSYEILATAHRICNNNREHVPLAAQRPIHDIQEADRMLTSYNSAHRSGNITAIRLLIQSIVKNEEVRESDKAMLNIILRHLQSFLNEMRFDDGDGSDSEDDGDSGGNSTDQTERRRQLSEKIATLANHIHDNNSDFVSNSPMTDWQAHAHVTLDKITKAISLYPLYKTGLSPAKDHINNALNPSASNESINVHLQRAHDILASIRELQVRGLHNDDRKHAATRVQSLFRGQQDRQRVQTLREEKAITLAREIEQLAKSIDGNRDVPITEISEKTWKGHLWQGNYIINRRSTSLDIENFNGLTDPMLEEEASPNIPNLKEAHRILETIREQQRAKAGGSDSSKSGNDPDDRGSGGSSPPSAGPNNGPDNTQLAAKTFSAWRDTTANRQRQRAALNQLESTRNNHNVRNAFDTWRSPGASASGASAGAPPLDVQQYTIAPRTPRGPAILAVARQVYEAATGESSLSTYPNPRNSFGQPINAKAYVEVAQNIMGASDFIDKVNSGDTLDLYNTALKNIGALAQNKSKKARNQVYQNAYNSLRRLLAALNPNTARPGSLPTDAPSGTPPPFPGRSDGPPDTQLAVGAHHHQADPHTTLALQLARSGQTVTREQIAIAMVKAVTLLPDLLSSLLRPSPDLRTAHAAAQWLSASSSTPHLLTNRAPEHAIVPHTANAASVSLTPETARQFEQLIQGVMNAIQQASLNERAQVMARLNRLPEPQIIALNAVAASLPDHLKKQFRTLTWVRPDNSMTNQLTDVSRPQLRRAANTFNPEMLNQLTDVRHDHSDNGARNPELAAKTSGAWRSRAEASTSGASAGTPPLDVQQYTIAPRTPRGPAILAVARQVYEAATGESSLSTYPNPRNSFGQPINAKAYVEVAQNIMGASDFIDKVNSGDTLDLYNTALKNIGALAQNKSKKARNQVYETAYNSLRRLLAALNPETARPGSLPTDAPPSPGDMVTRHFVKPMNRALSQQRAMDRLQAVGAFKAEGQRAAARRATTTQPEPPPYVRASRHYHKNKTGQSAPPRGPLTGRPSWAETPPGIPAASLTGALVRGSTPSPTARVPSPRPGTPPAPPFTVATAGHPSSTDLLVRAAQGNISATAALTGLSRLSLAEQYRLMGNILLTIPGLVRTLINYKIPGAKDLEPAATRVEDAITGHMDNGTLRTQTQLLTDGSDSPTASVALVRAVVDLVTQTGTLVSRLPPRSDEMLQKIVRGLPIETIGSLSLFTTLAQDAGFSLPPETFRFLEAAGVRPLLADGTSTRALVSGATPSSTARVPSPRPGTPPAPPLTVATAGAEAFPPSEDLGRLSPSNQADKELTDHVLTSIQDAISMTAVKHTKKNYTKTIQQVVTSRRAPDEPYLDVYLKYVSLALGELAGLVEKEITPGRTNDPLIPLHQNLKELARKLTVASGEVTESLDDPSNSKFENGRTLLREAISLVREVAETLSRAKDIALPSLSSSSSSDDSSDNDSDSSRGGAGGWSSRGGGGGGHNFGTGTILNPLSPSTRRGRARSLSPRGSRGRARIRKVRSASPSSRRPEALPSVRGAWGKAPVSDEAIAAAHSIFESTQKRIETLSGAYPVKIPIISRTLNTIKKGTSPPTLESAATLMLTLIQSLIKQNIPLGEKLQEAEGFALTAIEMLKASQPTASVLKVLRRIQNLIFEAIPLGK